MLNKKINAGLVFLILSLSTLYAQIAEAKVPQYIINGIQKIIDEDRIAYQIPGIQVSVIFPGETQPYDFVSGTTTLNGTTLVTPIHTFQINSETKSFTAALLLQLEAIGKLSLDDSIGKWLPSIPLSWKNVTVRQLLNQTSGIYEYLDTDQFSTIEVGSDFKKQWSPSELIQLSFNEKPYFSPGMGWHYSNSNYILAGMIIFAVTGKSVEENMKDLFHQLNLANTHYIPYAYNEKVMQNMVHGYSESGMFPEEPKDITYFNMSMADASGAIISTTHDTALWIKKLMTGILFPTKQLKEFMSTVNTQDGQPQPIITKDVGYGLGIVHNTLIDDFDFFGQDRWSHEGGGIGYRAMMLYLKSKDIVITTAINHVRKPDQKDVSDNDHLLIDLVTFILKSDISKKSGA